MVIRITFGDGLRVPVAAAVATCASVRKSRATGTIRPAVLEAAVEARLCDMRAVVDLRLIIPRPFAAVSLRRLRLPHFVVGFCVQSFGAERLRQGSMGTGVAWLEISGAPKFRN